MQNVTIRLIYVICGIFIPHITLAMGTPSTSVPSTQPTISIYDDFQQLFHRPQSPYRGDSKWENVQLVQDCRIASVGINPDATLFDKAADAIIGSRETSVDAPHTTISESSPVATATYDHSTASNSVNTVDIDHQNSSHDKVLVEHHTSHDTHYQGEFRSSDIANWRELDYQSSQYSDLADQGNPLKQNKYHKGDSLEFRADQTPIRERFVYLLLPSSNPKALSAQLQVTRGNAIVSREYFTQSIQDKYRNFLWTTSKHFNPINSPERQAQALKILYPAIKAYFATDRIGLLSFLKENGHIAGALRLYDIETKWGSYLVSNIDSLATVSEKLNIFSNNTTTETVRDSEFSHNLSKLASYVEAGKFAEAKAILEQSQQLIYHAKVYDAERKIMIDEHDCLSAQYTALTEKMFDKYKSDPHFKICDRFLQRGTMSLAEAFKILDARHYIANSLTYRMGYDPKNLSTHDKSLLYEAIDGKTKDTYGRQLIFDHKDLLNEQELNALKEKLECFGKPLQTQTTHNQEAVSSETIGKHRTDIPERSQESLAVPNNTSHQISTLQGDFEDISAHKEITEQTQNILFNHEKTQATISDENKNITPENFLNDLEKGAKTRGPSEIYIKGGGFEEAVKDFKNFNPSQIKSNPGLITGKLTDGRHITVREESKDGRATLEFYNPETEKKIKIRY